MVRSTLLGFPRMGPHRELKTALEHFWLCESTEAELRQVGANVRALNLEMQRVVGINLIPSGDFSFYDHVLDMSALFGVVPSRYGWSGGRVDAGTYFAMARGAQKSGVDVPAAEMTKWFDTNYHYIVPEFEKGQKFRLSSNKPVDDYLEARHLGIDARPVLVGPVSYLLLGKDRDGGTPLDHLEPLLEVYIELLKKLESAGATWVQCDEPFLVCDLDERAQLAFAAAYERIRAATKIKIFVTTPFGTLDDNLDIAMRLPIQALHVDLVRGAGQLDDVLNALPSSMILAMGLIDGRNIWRDNLERSLQSLEKVVGKIGSERVWIAPSCSFLHVPYDLDLELSMNHEIRGWLSFAKQKLDALVYLERGINDGRETIVAALAASGQALESRRTSSLIHETSVQERMREQPLNMVGRATSRAVRAEKQKQALELPLFPTTTLGSYPQTHDVRQTRAAFRNGRLAQADYDAFIKKEIEKCVVFQESVGLDVLVHGEFERNDMVEFFGEKLRGFAFTEQGWVQSYGSRCVKPPIIYGDVLRPAPMTVATSVYAQSLTDKPMKGMLTGPVTILQWSFVRDDQPRSATAHQIALALQDEVLELEENGLKIVQIDEPAFREGLPLRRYEQQAYFSWAVQAFRLASTGVRDETQIHTHMCYSDFNGIIGAIKNLDADVISIETSRSQMELLDAFATFKYPGQIGPGVYDIHSPRVPPEDEIVSLIEKACRFLDPAQIWINPDCGLKTREWPEVRLALSHMVMAARTLRAHYGQI